MHRREWLHLCAAALLPRPSRGAETGLVSTPAKREAYLKEMLQALCTEIGPRPAGSAGYDAGARRIEREMRRALPSVVRDEFSFRCWEPVGRAEFVVGTQSLETYIGEDSPGTPHAGVSGKLRKGRGGEYEILDPASAKVLAQAQISEFGRAIASLHSGTGSIPLFNIGRQDVPVLDRAVQQALPVHATGEVRWISGARTSNIAGTLPGASKNEILFVAHADTKYNTPGANDNTASLICLLMLAQAIPATHPKATVTFLATSGEERHFLGAKHYAQLRKEQGTLGNIRVCINFDSLTYGPNLQVATTDRELERLIFSIHRDLHLTTHPKLLRQDDTMDSAPFHAAGARTVHLNSRGDDARTLHLWHRPEDLAPTINPAFVENAFQVSLELCARLSSTLS